MDAIVPGLEHPPLREIEGAQARMREGQRPGIDGAEALDGLAAALARRLHVRHERADGLASLGPDGGRRFRAPARRRGHGGEAGEPRGKRLEAVARFLEHLGGDLARAHLGQREVMDDLADGPVGVVCSPVRLHLTQALDLFEEPRAHGLEVVPERFNGWRQGHRHSSVGCGTFSIIAHGSRTWYKVRCPWPTPIVRRPLPASRGARARRVPCTRIAGFACARTWPSSPTGARRSTAWWSARSAWACCPSWTPTPCSWWGSIATSPRPSTGRCRRGASMRARAPRRRPSASWARRQATRQVRW